MPAVLVSRPMREHSSAILRTKLRRPGAAADAVQRQRLFDQLDKGSSGSVTLVSAPAGFGKSRLVSQWLEARVDLPAAWLSLDEGDNDLRTFLVYLLSALGEAAPGSWPVSAFPGAALRRRGFGTSGPRSCSTASNSATLPLLRACNWLPIPR